MISRRPTNRPREAKPFTRPTNQPREAEPFTLHLIDGTYELFRHFYGLRRFTKGKDRPYGAVAGVLQGVLQMIESGDRVKGYASRGPTYLGVATDHVIESFRNRLWAGYKTGAGIDGALRAQFHPLEEALAAMGVVVWPMIELEADDALASAAHLASKDKKVRKVAIWTPDKDLAQCVRDTRVVQIDGRRKIIRDAAGIREKFGVDPPLIPDLLALVGDAADGYPGIPGIGAKTAAQLLNRHGPIESLPPDILGKQRKLAALQETRDAAHRCATLQEGRDAALARCDADVRGLGGADGGTAASRAVRKGGGPITVRH
jgi:5'-3' exonuclease